MKNNIFNIVLVALFISGCGVDQNSVEYDERRYNELQKSNCHDMASVLSAAGIMETPEDFDIALKRCQDTQSLDYEQYKQFSDHGRATGVWDVYTVFPEKK